MTRTDPRPGHRIRATGAILAEAAARRAAIARRITKAKNKAAKLARRKNRR